MAGTSHADSCPQGSKITKKTCLNFILRKLQKLKLLSLSRHQSRIFFFMSRFVFQVEDFFFHVEICISSRVFSHVEIFISSRDFFFSCRDLYFKPSFLSHVENFFMLTFFFSRGEVFLSQGESFVIFEVFQVDISQFKARCYPGVLVGISWQ